MINWNEVFEYRDGHLYWRVPGPGRCMILPAGCSTGAGRRVVNFGNKHTYAHRVIWEMHNGEIPKLLEIDHRDGDQSNNRIENLRLSTRSENERNKGLNSRNTSGIKGVSRCKRDNKWTVRVQIGGSYKYFGRFEELELAELVANEAREKYHGEFCNHG